MPRSCPHIQCYDCDNYGHVAMDCPDKIPPSGTPDHCRTNNTDRSRRSPSRCPSHTRHSCYDQRDRSRFSHSGPDPVTTDTGVIADMTTAGTAPVPSTDPPIAAPCVTGAPVHTTTIETLLTADLLLAITPPEMTADLIQHQTMPVQTNPRIIRCHTGMIS